MDPLQREKDYIKFLTKPLNLLTALKMAETDFNYEHQILPKTKVCKCCNIAKPFTSFYLRSSKKTYETKCKLCYNKIRRLRYKKRPTEHKKTKNLHDLILTHNILKDLKKNKITITIPIDTFKLWKETLFYNKIKDKITILTLTNAKPI